MARRNYSNIAVDTTLAVGINGVVTTMDVVSATGWPIAPFVAVIDPGTANEELVLVGSKSGVTFGSLTRGFGGTSAVAHNAAVPIKHALTKEDHDLVWTHTHVPGTDDTQQISHDLLSGVSANDHHAQQHAISGADHTGQLDHGALSGLSDDDHPQYLKEKASGGAASELVLHTHLDTNQGGQVDHGALTGLSDNDHPQYVLASALQGLVEGMFESGFAEDENGVALTGTPSDKANVDFTNPGGWATYTLLAWSMAYVSFSATPSGASAHIFIDGAQAGILALETGDASTTAQIMAFGKADGLTGSTEVKVVLTELQGSVFYNWSQVMFLAYRTS